MFALPILLSHLVPVVIHNAREDVGVELDILDVAEVFGQCLAGQCFGLSLAAFIPSDPPTFDVLSLVYPCFFHSAIVSALLRGTVALVKHTWDRHDV